MPFANPKTLEKASRFDERFREIIADPVNLLINRVPEAGFVDAEGMVVLHNGNRVPLHGPTSYYGNFSDILIINRGVHEPLEEYCFQEVLATLRGQSPVMLELGSYWAHYSMWFKKLFPHSVCHMVESDEVNLQSGRENFKTNGFKGEFHKGLIGRNGLQVDNFIREQKLERVDILHVDIQGFEGEMLEGAKATLAEHRVARIFISTHSENLHQLVASSLRSFGYRIEVSSPFDNHTTSCDGFILASAPNEKPLFDEWNPLGRIEILHSSPKQLLSSITLKL